MLPLSTLTQIYNNCATLKAFGADPPWQSDRSKYQADYAAQKGHALCVYILVGLCLCDGFKPVWNDRSFSLSSKIQLMRFLITSIFLYACESWTLTAEPQRRIQAMEMRCYRKILCISYKDHVTNEEVHAKIQQAIGPHEDLLTIVKRR